MALPPPYILPPPGFAMRSTSLSHRLRPSLILLPGPFARTAGGGSVAPHSHLGMLILLPFVPPFLILGLTFNPLKERCTDKCYVLTNSIVWNLSPPVWVHHSAKEMGGVQVMEGLTSKRLDHFCPKVFHPWCQLSLVSHIIAITDILQGARHIVQLCTPAYSVPCAYHG